VGCGVCILIVRLLLLEVLAASRKVCVCSSCVEEKNCKVANCSSYGSYGTGRVASQKGFFL